MPTKRASASAKEQKAAKALKTSVSTTAPGGGRARGSTPAQQAVEFRRDGPGYQGSLMGGFSFDRDLNPVERRKLVGLSRLNYRRSGVYGQVIDALVDFTVGDGVMVSCEDERAQEFWDKFAEDPANAWERTYRQRVTTKLVDGEYLLTLTVPYRSPALPATPTAAAVPAQLSGTVLAGRMEPEGIKAFHRSVVNADRVLAVDFESPGPGLPEFTLPIARPQPDPSKAFRDNGDGTATALLFWACNKIGGRGAPYLSRSLDKATMLDAVVDELARKAEYTSRFWLHANFESTGDKREDGKIRRELLAWLKSWVPGEAAATSGKVTVNAVAPNLGVVDAKAFVELVLEYILGSHGIPRMWYAAGGDTNRATAVEQGTPIHRRLDALQSDLRCDLEDVIRFVLWVGKQSGMIPEGASDEFSVTMADVATRDSIRDVNELNGLVASLDAFVASDIITEQERQDIGRRALQGKSFGDLIKPENAPVIVPDVGLEPPPPGAVPGYPSAPPDGGTSTAPNQPAGSPVGGLPPGA